jgi:hypothetical protein
MHHMINKKQASQPPTTISESKKTKPKPHHAPVAPYGVSDPQGYVMKRIQQAKPALWAKIQNWD